ncbi:XRE family transcriptional regulator [Xanthobacter autotrophicus DSM 431]|uniref:ImmA/IrrE family metallo-endopeptidase n=1 Tax=Xanthobacter nonsaccharivorans TaxID=3119912 RepID=UPI0037278AF1
MPTKVPVPVRPAVLAWARRSACVTMEAAAKAANVPVERLEEWEHGEGAPSLPQLRKLAEKYHRPLAVMLLPEPPREFQALKDFRRIDPTTGGLSPMPARVAYEIRLAQERRSIALEIIEEVGGEVQPFKLSATIDDDPETVAVSVRQFLRVSPTEIAQWARKSAVFDGWRAAIEAQDVLVFVMGGSHGPAVRDVRGFAVPATALPVVAVNGKDKTNGRTFTLLHEFAHLLLGEGVVENVVAPQPMMPVAVRRVERWCNAVAAAVMMPVDAVVAVAEGKGPSSDWGSTELARAAEQLGASREAALIRFMTLGRASGRSYAHKRAAFEEEYQAFDEPSGTSGGPPHHKQMIGRYGKSYARHVLSGYRDRRISLNDAAAFLGVQAKHIPYIEQQAFKAA